MRSGQGRQPVEVAVSGTDDSAGSGHGFGDDGGDVLGADLLDLGADLVDVVGGDACGLRDQRFGAVAVPVVLQAGDAGPEGVQPVVSAVAAEDDLLGAASLELPVPAGELAGQVDRVRAAAGQHHLGAGDRAEGDETVGQPQGRLVGEPAERVVCLQPRHLLVRGAGDPLPAVADVRVPQAGCGIQQPLPGRRGQPGPLTAGDHQPLGARCRHVRLRVPQGLAEAASGRLVIHHSGHVLNCTTVEL